jgi:hypothetical protein
MFNHMALVGTLLATFTVVIITLRKRKAGTLRRVDLVPFFGVLGAWVGIAIILLVRRFG